MALEEIPLKRIRTPSGDVAEYSSFRDGLLTVAQAIMDLRNAMVSLDKKVADDLNTMDEEVGKMREEISGLKEGFSGLVENIRGLLGELVEKISTSIEEKLSKVAEAVEEGMMPVLEDLRSRSLDLPELSRLVKVLGLRLESLEARVASLEEELKRLRLLTLSLG